MILHFQYDVDLGDDHHPRLVLNSYIRLLHSLCRLLLPGVLILILITSNHNIIIIVTIHTIIITVNNILKPSVLRIIYILQFNISSLTSWWPSGADSTTSNIQTRPPSNVERMRFVKIIPMNQHFGCPSPLVHHILDPRYLSPTLSRLQSCPQPNPTLLIPNLKPTDSSRSLPDLGSEPRDSTAHLSPRFANVEILVDI